MILRGKNALKTFPSRDSVSIQFQEKNATAYSTASIFTKLLGRHDITVIITSDELWITAESPFLAVFADQADLIHRIPLHQIFNISKEPKQIRIDFRMEEDEKQVVLMLEHTQDFLDQISSTEC